MVAHTSKVCWSFSLFFLLLFIIRRKKDGMLINGPETEKKIRESVDLLNAEELMMEIMPIIFIRGEKAVVVRTFVQKTLQY
jgi:hypothetical protein